MLCKNEEKDVVILLIYCCLSSALRYVQNYTKMLVFRLNSPRTMNKFCLLYLNRRICVYGTLSSKTFQMLKEGRNLFKVQLYRVQNLICNLHVKKLLELQFNNIPVLVLFDVLIRRPLSTPFFNASNNGCLITLVIFTTKLI